jgi:hypothetical protein
MSAAQEEQALYDMAEIKELRKQLASAKRTNERMLKVLTKVSSIVMEYIEFHSDEEVGFCGDQGSERREYEQGEFHGRVTMARELYPIIMEQEDES